LRAGGGVTYVCCTTEGALQVVLITALLALATAGASPARAGPSSIDALGDSITRAFNTGCPFYWTDCALTNSWATGSNSKVNSVYTRLSAFGPVTRYNDAVSGAKMDDLPGQATKAVSRNVELVGILMGANDACGGSSGVMTEVASYRANFEQAMATLTTGLPNADIKVGSIPDIYQLWEIFYKNKSAVSAWQTFKMCESLLANPTSTAPADMERRTKVRHRIQEYNAVLQSVCAEYVKCEFDNHAGFNTKFKAEHVSTADYFHPSVAGQALIASVAWEVLGY
jgi:lysophospholipase L1-like esterase